MYKLIRTIGIGGLYAQRKDGVTWPLTTSCSTNEAKEPLLVRMLGTKTLGK